MPKEPIYSVQNNSPIKTLKYIVVILCGYLFLAMIFYYLMGDQLHYRTSRSNIELMPGTSASTELADGNVVEQYFTTDVQRIDKLTVLWGTYGRESYGTAYIELINVADGSILASQTYMCQEMEEGYRTELSMNPPLEGLYEVPLKIRITSDAVSGSAPTPVMNNSQEMQTEFALFLNGVATQGRLCFAIQGTDYIWTGLHYWKFVIIGAILLVLSLSYIYYKVMKQQSVLVLTALLALRKYWFLIKQLVARDFKIKYKRSFLGVIWSLLNPLLTMLVQYWVFSSLFRFDIPYYPVYLISGIVMFNFFTEACGMMLWSIVGNSGLITKVYVPKYIYPLTRSLSSMVNLLLALIPLFGVVLLSGLSPTKAWLMLVFELACLLIFCLGMGMMLASSMVFFRDTQFLWGVFSMIWMYLTPLFYPESILPPSTSWVLKINPMYYFVKFTRICLMDGVSPEPIMFVQCIFFAFVFLILGAYVFRKTQDKFIIYL